MEGFLIIKKKEGKSKNDHHSNNKKSFTYINTFRDELHDLGTEIGLQRVCIGQILTLDQCWLREAFFNVFALKTFKIRRNLI